MTKFPSPLVLVAAGLACFLVNAAATVPGAGVIVAFSTLFFGAIAVVIVSCGGRARTPISQRPLDLIIVAGWTMFAVISILVDAVQVGVGPVPMTDAALDSGYQPVNLLRSAFQQWTLDCDPLLARNPLWYWVIAILSPLLYFPFYAFGVYAMLFEREWIRDPALIWGSLLSSTTIVIIAEELYGEYASPNRIQMLGGYAPYVVLPLLVMVRVWRRPLFARNDK